MMEEILELIIDIITIPFESKIDSFVYRIDSIQKKPLRIAIKVLLIIVLFLLIFTIIGLFNYIFRGYFI